MGIVFTNGRVSILEILNLRDGVLASTCQVETELIGLTAMSANTYSKEDCIEALLEAEEILGHSPEVAEYKSLDVSPSMSTIRNRFGTWNEAKEAAGLEKAPNGRRYKKKPNLVDMSKNKWRDLTADKRHRIRRRNRLQRIKLIEGCCRCGFNQHPAALEFHHKNKSLKSFEITRGFVSGSYDWKETRDEIAKCEVLCSNCHRVEESELSFNVE